MGDLIRMSHSVHRRQQALQGAGIGAGAQRQRSRLPVGSSRADPRRLERQVRVLLGNDPPRLRRPPLRPLSVLARRGVGLELLLAGR